jgi:hypothetical protein
LPQVVDDSLQFGTVRFFPREPIGEIEQPSLPVGPQQQVEQDFLVAATAGCGRRRRFTPEEIAHHFEFGGIERVGGDGQQLLGELEFVGGHRCVR